MKGNVVPESKWHPYREEARGAAGLAALSRWGTEFSVQDVDRFRAEIRIVPLAELRLVVQKATPHRVHRRANPDVQAHADEFYCTFTLSGSVVGHYRDHALAQKTDTVMVFGLGDPLHYVASGPTMMASVHLSRGVFGQPALQAIRSSLHPIHGPNPLTSSMRSMILSLLATPPEPGSSAAAAIERSLVTLIESIVLEDAAAAERRGTDARATFAEARAAIDRAITAGDTVDSASIAERLGVEVAELARVMRRHGTTLARLTREQRLDRLATLLRSRDVDLPIADLAHAAGFSGGDVAARVFKQHYDMTMGDYRTLMHL